MPHRRTSPKIFTNATELRHNPTDAEAKVWQILRMRQVNNIRFRRQHAIGPYVVDFCAPREKLIIEVDGGQHLDQEEYDAERTIFLEAQGYWVMRFWNDEVLNNSDGVLLAILEALGR